MSVAERLLKFRGHDLITAVHGESLRRIIAGGIAYEYVCI